MSALPPDAGRALAVRLLEARGLRLVARNTRGDSLYLAMDAAPRMLRVSNHARTGKQRSRRRDVAASLVIGTPKTTAQIAAMVEVALRNYARALELQAAVP